MRSLKINILVQNMCITWFMMYNKYADKNKHFVLSNQ
jgi:hypothetical protein